MTDQPQTTDGDRAAAALTAGAQRALANGNMGQIDAYRCNQVTLLIEQVRAEERERCAEILQKWFFGDPCHSKAREEIEHG